MPGKVYVQQPAGSDGSLVSLEERGYETEPVLQELLERHPDLLAGDQMDAEDPRRWLLIGRELPIRGEESSAGRIDHMFVDHEGIPTFVEVKRSDDTRIRREVVGQMLDYVANATAFFPAEYLQERFEARCQAAGLDPEKTLGDFLQDNEKDLDSFWKQVRANLSAGRIRLLFVADIIPQKLRSIIEFLNRQMGETEVFGLEVRQFVGSNLRTYVPRLIGQTSEAVQRKSVGGRPARQWTEESFFKQMEGSRPEPEVRVARRLLEWANTRELSVRWGQGGQTGSFSPRLIIGDQEHRLMSVYGYGSVEVVFIWMRALPFSDRTRRLELLHKLNTIPGVALAEEHVDARPAIQLAVLALGNRLEKFLEVFDWVLAEARNRSDSPAS